MINTLLIAYSLVQVGYNLYESHRQKKLALAEVKERLPGVDDFKAPIVTESDPVAVLFGTHWLRGPNVLWYGLMRTRQEVGDQNSGTVRYDGAMLLSYCAGPVDKVLRITGDGVLLSDTVYDLTSGPLQFLLDAETSWGDPQDGGQGGLKGIVNLLPGLPNQAIPDLFSLQLFDEAGNPIIDLLDENGMAIMPSYRGLFTVLLGDFLQPGEQPAIRPNITGGTLQAWFPQDSVNRFYFGTSQVFKPIDMLLQRITQRGYGQPQWYPETADISVTEMNPAHIIHELLTDEVYGYGISASNIDDTINDPVSTFQVAANRLVTDTLGLSFVWGQQQTRLDTMQEVLRHITGVLIRNPKSGKYELRLFRDDYVVSQLLVLGPSQIQEVLRYARPDVSTLPTILEAKYMDRDMQMERVVKQDDQAGLLTRGEIREETYYQMAARGDIAARIASNDMLEYSAPLAVVELVLPYCEGCDFLPGDVFVWQWPDYGIAQMVLRVLSVTRGMVEDGTVRVRCREDAYSFRETVYESPPITAWVDPVRPPINAPSIGFELPLGLWLAGIRQSNPWASVDDFANDERGVGALVVRRPNDAHVSYALWSESLSGLPRLSDDGANWSTAVRVDGVYNPTSFGVDAVEASTKLRLKNIGAVPEIGALILFSLPGGGKQPQEIVYVTDVNYVDSAWEIDVERALFDTDELFDIFSIDGSTIDPVGAILGYLFDIDDPLEVVRSYSIDVPKDLVTSGGVTLLRALTNTSRGTLPFEDATQTSVPIEGRPFKPIPPYIFNITEVETGTAILWRTRNRRRDRLVFTNEGVSVEAGVTYTVRIFEVEPTPQLLHTETNIAGTAPGYLYTFVDEDKDRGGGLADVLRIEIDADRDGVMSYYTYKRIYKRATQPPPQETGDVYAWGFNNVGQLGTNDLIERTEPTLIDEDNWSIVSAGDTHSLGIKDGDLYAWGNGAFGKLGTNDTVNRLQPTLIDQDNWSMVSAGHSHSLGIKDGDLYAWGSGANGKLGTGDLITRRVPIFVSSGWSIVSAGFNHSLGIKDGDLYAWGSGANGRLGTGDTENQLEPTLIDEDGWSMVSAGHSHSLGIKDGDLYAWGDNFEGQLGTGDRIERIQPTLINQDGWSIVSAGFNHSLGIKGGDLYAWGSGVSGRLGTGGTARRLTPTLINQYGWSIVSAGGSHSLGIKDGDLYAWGNGANGRLGTGDTENQLEPTLIDEDGWSIVSAGGSHSLGIKSDDIE
jgi:hypothetical protein